MIGNHNYGTGRRKSRSRAYSCAAAPASSTSTAARRGLFARETGRMIARQPLVLTDNLTTFESR